LVYGLVKGNIVRRTEPQQARRNAGPATTRGAERKQELLVAARRVFEHRGFAEARVADITREAGVSHGTFYTYFDTKEAVFVAVAQQAIDQMLASMAITVPDEDLHERVHRFVRRFVMAYQPHVAIISIIEQVATSSPELCELRLDLRQSFVRRTERALRRLIDAGVAEPSLDIQYTAESLGSMLEHSCYIWLALRQNYDEDRLVEAMAAIWEKSIARRPPT